MGNSQGDTDKIRNAITRLKRGCLTDDIPLRDRARLDLVDIGDTAADHLLVELRRLDLEKVDYREQLSLTVGLISVLHDLSETQSRKFMAKALRSRCHPSVSAIFKSIRRFDTENFRQTQIDEILVFEEATLNKSVRATWYIGKWLAGLSAKEIRGISRVYVLNDDLERDYWGHYVMRLNVIAIVWRRPYFHRLPLNWLRRLTTEKILYHEIGHHCLGHREGGQDPEQEKEADNFSIERLRAAHPVMRYMVKALRLILLPFRFILRRIDSHLDN